MSLTSKLSCTTWLNLILANQTKNTNQKIHVYLYIKQNKQKPKKKEIARINKKKEIPLPFSTHPPFISTTTPPTSHLTHTLFQSLSRFTGVGFNRTKRHHFSGGSNNIHPAAVYARVWTPVGTGLSTPQDGAIMARPKLAGRHRRLTGHKYLRSKFSNRVVSSCRFSLSINGLSPHHEDGVLNTYASGRRGWESVRVHIGPHWAEGVRRALPGWVWVGVLV